MSATTKTVAKDVSKVNDAKFVHHELEFAIKRAIIDAFEVPDHYVQATGQKGPVS